MRSNAMGSVASSVLKHMLVVLLLSCFFILVWLRASITNVEYRIGELEKTKMQALKERKQLVAKKAQALSIQEVQKVAMDRLGLVFPDRAKMVQVKRDKGDVPYEVSFKTDR